ncbi:MAG: cohesin domain-containing protein [Spirochaetes bacterium]|nr:cohesin domain-containing protein [Spirochaetota bacterium]
MNIKKTIVLLLILLCSIAVFGQNNIVKAVINNSEYKVGDLIDVSIQVENNQGLHGLFFDLEYDSSILQFEDVIEGSFLRRILEDNELLYAEAGSEAASSYGSHVIVSYTLKGEGKETHSEGMLIKLTFRVLQSGPIGETYNFSFRECGIVDKENNDAANVSWQASEEFTIENPNANAYVLIKAPYQNQVFSQATANLNLICSNGSYQIKLHNEDTGYSSAYIPCTTGYLENQTIDLDYGYNDLKAELYDQSNVLIASDIVKVYRSTEDQFIKITYPADHELLNTDMVEVEVESPFDEVLINGETAFHNGELNGTKKVYKEKIWLKEGFNTITAVVKSGTNVLYSNTCTDMNSSYLEDTTATWTENEFENMYLLVNGQFAEITSNNSNTLFLDNSAITVTGPGYEYKIKNIRDIVDTPNIKYTDSIQVYYQKDDSIFSLVQPIADSNIKPTDYAKLLIKGEISSEYQTLADPATGLPVKNTVTLKVVYTPSNRLKSPVTLVDNQLATIEESDYSDGLGHAKFMFYNDFDIPLAGLENGEIEVIAYKNKNGYTWDNAIHRVCYIDNNRLWIDLVQPNVYTKDVLDTKANLVNFNELNPISADNSIQVDSDGAMMLKSSNPVIEGEAIAKVADIIETPANDLYALVNNISTGNMFIYKKTFGTSSWTEVVKKDGLYGYKLCYTNNGILVGTSNLYSTEDSGLFILEDRVLTNLDFGEKIDHVQYIFNQNGKIYIYGKETPAQPWRNVIIPK